MSTITITPERVTPPPLEKQTTVGNYFVSNYPPFSFWKPEDVGELSAALERPLSARHLWGSACTFLLPQTLSLLLFSRLY
jgi:hypothetical protein